MSMSTYYYDTPVRYPILNPDFVHQMHNGIIIDPTIDRNPAHWIIQRDPPPDADLVSFANYHIGYLSYDPPKGFSAEDLMGFRGAGECLTLKRAQGLIELRNRLGTVEYY
ncbi:hypothetical protein BJ165DRAFT_1399413 [Panaeolus papilionaceus]|nr:hypothetical protein BJ165DRAFT_1399413 [Panaeolus papilionaceus]